MILSISLLLNNPKILSAVIDRTVVSMLEMDKVFWKDYLIYDKANPDGTFKTYLGTQIGVIAGTVIDRYANKPLRKRHALTSGTGEVACLGDAYQMDNTRIERLEVLIAEYNEMRTDEARAIKLNEIIDFLVDDVRQAMLAPMKRFDLMVGSLRFNGKCKVDGKENKKGVSIVDITLPIKIIKATVADKDNILTWLQREFVDKLRPKGYALKTIELNRTTFNNVIASSEEFKNKYVLKFGSQEYHYGDVVTADMVNNLLGAIDSPLRFKIKEEWVQISEDEQVNAVPDFKASLLPTLDPRKLLGYMKWKRPLEMTDPIDGRTYVPFEDGKGFISSYRNSEGRFLEYGFEAIPDIEIPNKMAIADFSALQ
jgi:hypothetical protein